ncbi:hypothetical protein Q5P01_023120 [Channa striata]|uniref:Uncharacterized protein n=1 Tax=Channa striata TaxID=64152 RepID=A0AA88LQT0_CHASR|nr:hypothetical protein Q5P01_023120 [Channa striata]
MNSQNSSAPAKFLPGSCELEQMDASFCPAVPEGPVDHLTELPEPSPRIHDLFSPRSNPEDFALLEGLMLESFFGNSVGTESLQMEKQKLNEELFFSLLPDSLPTPHKSSQDGTDKTRQTAEDKSTSTSLRNSSAELREPSPWIRGLFGPRSNPEGFSLSDELMLERYFDEFNANDYTKMEEKEVTEDMSFSLLPNFPSMLRKSSQHDTGSFQLHFT